jgi:hypothetical protein
MKMYKLKYFKKSDTICGDDFKLQDEIENINLDFLLSLSEIKNFRLPLSGTYVDNYAVVTMSNNDMYCIRENVFNELKEIIDEG